MVDRNEQSVLPLLLSRSSNKLLQIALLIFFTCRGAEDSDVVYVYEEDEEDIGVNDVLANTYIASQSAGNNPNPYFKM